MDLVDQNECLNKKISPKKISPSLQRLPRLPSANSHERLLESSTGSWRPQKSPNCRTLWSLESANWIIQGELVASFPGNRHIIYFTRACNASADDVFPQKVRRTYLNSLLLLPRCIWSNHFLILFRHLCLRAFNQFHLWRWKQWVINWGQENEENAQKNWFVWFRLIGQKYVLTRKKRY